MVEKEFITISGKLKKDIMFNTMPESGDKYYFVPLETDEESQEKLKILLKKLGEEGKQVSSVMVSFWEKKFDAETCENIANLKENQFITVEGYISFSMGRDSGLVNVSRLLAIENK